MKEQHVKEIIIALVGLFVIGYTVYTFVVI